MSGVPMEEAREQLYAGSLKAFVARRKALAKTLRDAGDKDGARALGALAKPTLPAWVLNQLARHSSSAMKQALEAVDQQRDLQLGALSGGLDAAALARAKQLEKDAVSELTRLAAEVLEGDGHPSAKGTLDKVMKSLRAAAIDPESRALLEAGVLSKDVADVGFDAVASQLDPALLLAALTTPAKPPPKRRKVDGMFARSARSDATRGEDDEVDEANEAEEAEEQAPSALATARAEPPMTAAEAEAEAAARRELERTQKLAGARAAAAAVRTAIAEQRKIIVERETLVVELESQLNVARAEARTARRELSELKTKLEQADKRIRVLEA